MRSSRGWRTGFPGASPSWCATELRPAAEEAAAVARMSDGLPPHGPLAAEEIDVREPLVAQRVRLTEDSPDMP
ncbi:hypothetical protein ACFWA4_15885 [Streptomyces sp. NPDC060011]|uniref:hypothetical protein n=1 Tax=Streptomyces sp. NPDC060011 TaxID=3347037 RepID=UPI0036CD256A